MPLTLTGIGAITGLTSLPSSGLQLADANMPAGSVLQVVNATKTGQLEASFSSATDLGLSASITPTSSSSKILVLVNAVGCCTRNNNSSNNTWWHINLLRGSTSLIYFGNYIGINTSTIGPVPTFPSCCYLDSPATTSSVTYKIQGFRASGTNNCIFNYQDDTYPNYSTMTLLEIAA